MSVKEVEDVPLDSQHPDFNIKLVKMLSSLILQLSSLFRGPLGEAIDQPSLQEVPAYDYKSNQWIEAFLCLCEATHSQVLGDLLNYIYARREKWIGFDENLDVRVHTFFNTEIKNNE